MKIKILSTLLYRFVFILVSIESFKERNSLIKKQNREREREEKRKRWVK